MVQVRDADLMARMKGLQSEHTPALQRYQALSVDEAQALKASVDGSVRAWRHADGDVGPVPPLYFELNRFADRGTILPEGTDLEATGLSVDWMVGIDAAGRVVREGPGSIYVYGDVSIDRLVVGTASASRRNSRDTSVKGADRLILNESGLVIAEVSLSTGGYESNTYLYEYVNGLVSRKIWWSHRDDIIDIYRVERASDGIIDRIVIEPDSLVYARRKVATRRLVKRIEREVVHLIDLALSGAAEADKPIYAVVLTYSGGTASTLFPPSIWLGQQSLRAAVEAGDAHAEEMWDPLIGLMREVDFTTRALVVEDAMQLASERDEEWLPKVYRRLGKRLTRSLRARSETADDFVVVAFDPEYESIEDALKHVLSKQEFSQFEERGVVR